MQRCFIDLLKEVGGGKQSKVQLSSWQGSGGRSPSQPRINTALVMPEVSLGLCVCVCVYSRADCAVMLYGGVCVYTRRYYIHACVDKRHAGWMHGNTALEVCV